MPPPRSIPMPTAGRLAGAVLFAVLGWYLSQISTAYFIESRPPDYYVTTCLLVGLVLGWTHVGMRAGAGYAASVGRGLSAAFAFAVIVGFVLGFGRMLHNAMRLRYDGPVEAVLDTFQLMVDESLRFADPRYIASLLVGAVIAALMTEIFGQKFP